MRAIDWRSLIDLFIEEDYLVRQKLGLNNMWLAEVIRGRAIVSGLLLMCTLTIVPDPTAWAQSVDESEERPVAADSQMKDRESPESVEINGFIRSRSVISITPPSVGDWEYKIDFLVDNGTEVKKGDHVTTLTGTNLEKWLQEVERDIITQEVKMQQETETLLNDIEELKKKIAELEGEIQTLETDGVKSPVTALLKSARDIKKDALDLKGKKIDLELKKQELVREYKLFKISQDHLAENLSRYRGRRQKFASGIEKSKILASRDGVVVHKRIRWGREPAKVGATVYRGTVVLEVVDPNDLFVTAFLRESDYGRFLEVYNLDQMHGNKKVKGQKVDVRVVGKKEVTVSGKIVDISAVVMTAGDWDPDIDDRHFLYNTPVFKLKIDLDEIPKSARPNTPVLITANPVQTSVNPTASGGE